MSTLSGPESGRRRPTLELLPPPARRRGGIQATKLLFPVGRGRDLEQQTHEGYEWLYVLDGRLGLHLGPDLLVPGEAAEFDTRTPHATADAGEVVAEILILLGPQGSAPIYARAPRRSLPAEPFGVAALGCDRSSMRSLRPARVSRDGGASTWRRPG